MKREKVKKAATLILVGVLSILNSFSLDKYCTFAKVNDVKIAEVNTGTIEEETTTEYTYAEHYIYERLNVTQFEIDLIARVVMSESSIESYETKVAIAETVINRVLCPRFPNTVYEVIFAPNQYSTANNGDVTEECYQAVYQALSGVQYCSYMFYFREDYYFSWAEPYMNIGKMYFSLGEGWE